MSAEEYSKALKLGRKAYRSSVMRGDSPYLPVLERMLENTTIVSRESLGIVDIPLEQIAGTYCTGRQPTFTHEFLPLMDESSEFARKWIHLCNEHLHNGIHDPIQAYEFMNRFYIVEGHKRVSVLKYFGAFSIRGSVTRLVPQPDDTIESRIYREFLHFYQLTSINYLWFSREGGFDTLLKTVRKTDDMPWTEAERATFCSFHASFSRAFYEKSGQKLCLTVGDAMLVYLNIFDYPSSVGKTVSVISTELSRMWDEMYNYSANENIQLVLKPMERKSFFPSFSSKHLRIAFIHSKTASSSSWVYAHELGRRDLEAEYGGQIETICLDGADTDPAAEEAIGTAMAEHADLIFTTSPQLLNASVKAALANPKAKIYNCSLNTSHPSIRTYYARMYEAKFLMGVIAGCLTPDDKIGYIADYPIYGIIANINAFALGAQMVNPRAQIFLEWSKTTGQDSREKLHHSGISYISDQDTIAPDGSLPHHVGLYHCNGEALTNTALSVWRWGRLYKKIVQNYLGGGWKADVTDTRAINYWWGMDAGVIDLICSRSLPEGTAQLIQLLRNDIKTGSFLPFTRLIHTQDGTALDYCNHMITPEEIITMDWLASNVIGTLPAFQQLLPEAQALVRIQGVQKQ